MSPWSEGLSVGLLAVFTSGLLLSLTLTRLGFAQQRWGLDVPGTQVRKLHFNKVPRLGGVALFLAPLFAGWMLDVAQPGTARWLILLVGISLPCVVAGLCEDLTARVSPQVRLAGMVLSAGLLIVIHGTVIDRIGVEPLESIAPLMAMLTLVAVLSITNGINLIDGLNGLAGGSALLMYLALGAVALQVGDAQIATAAFILAGSTCGFLAWNWPRSRIFMGDAGAYFTGFTLGALSIATVQRNTEVSPWFAVLLLAYPLTEVAFTVWRRALGRRRPISKPDAVHLHHLVFRRVVGAAPLGSTLQGPRPEKWQQEGGLGQRHADAAFLHRSTGSLGNPHDARNAIAGALLWCFPLGSSLLATVYYANTAALVLCLLAFVPVYLRLYFRIAQFRTPFRLSPSRQS